MVIGTNAADGIADLSPTDLETVHESFRVNWPKLFGERGRLYLCSVDGAPAGVGAHETMPFMTEAQRLYRSMGFRYVEPFESEGSNFGLAKCEQFMLLEL